MRGLRAAVPDMAIKTISAGTSAATFSKFSEPDKISVSLGASFLRRETSFSSLRTTISGLNSLACSERRDTFPPEMAFMLNSPGMRLTTSKTFRPTEPVDPNKIISFIIMTGAPVLF